MPYTNPALSPTLITHLRELHNPFGWMYLNLNTSVSGGVYNPNAQAFVTTVMEASGQFSVGFEAIRLDSACDTTGGGAVLIP